jgi:hypothetical protein
VNRRRLKTNTTRVVEVAGRALLQRDSNCAFDFVQSLIIFCVSKFQIPKESFGHLSFFILFNSQVLSVSNPGEIEKITIANGIDGLNQEAIRLVKQMPKWKPGINNGKEVNLKIVIPITFSLN